MPENDRPIVPPVFDEPRRPQANRTLLGVLLALLGVAVLLALFFLLFGGDDTTASSDVEIPAVPTPLTLPTAAPTPDAEVLQTTADAEPTTAPVPTPAPVPEGFEACDTARAPSTTSTYIVDTNSVPLNQRAEPSVDGELAGTFPSGKADLVFTGDCLINLTDGYVWWQIFNGTDDVWIASDFVTPN